MEIPKLDCMPNNMWHIQNITTGLTVDSKASRIGKDNHPVGKRTFPKRRVYQDTYDSEKWNKNSNVL